MYRQRPHATKDFLAYLDDDVWIPLRMLQVEQSHIHDVHDKPIEVSDHVQEVGLLQRWLATQTISEEPGNSW